MKWKKILWITKPRQSFQKNLKLNLILQHFEYSKMKILMKFWNERTYNFTACISKLIRKLMDVLFNNQKLFVVICDIPTKKTVHNNLNLFLYDCNTITGLNLIATHTVKVPYHAMYFWFFFNTNKIRDEVSD